MCPTFSVLFTREIMQTFHCDNCDRQVFFENTMCAHCGWLLGYQPELQVISSFTLASEPPMEGAAARWRSVNPVNAGRLFRQCDNYQRQGVCNWMIDDAEAHTLCASCRLTTVIPTLDTEQNKTYWQRLEVAKRRLLYSLWCLQLQPPPKTDNSQQGLAFQFLEDGAYGEHVMTGHADGVITINIAEADPAYREKMREQMAEPYRTLLGHFRHESGHYYFDRLIADSQWQMQFASLFGDASADYASSLQRHYQQGPPPDWNDRFVSVYASSHPWEDWAETWAHYLHMFDTLETAYACGLQLRPQKRQEQDLVIEAAPLDADSFDQLTSSWFALTYVLNSLNRSIGMPDSYPFTLSTLVLEKLRFVDMVVRTHADTARAIGQIAT